MFVTHKFVVGNFLCANFKLDDSVGFLFYSYFVLIMQFYGNLLHFETNRTHVAIP